MGSIITGTGVSIPEHVVTNDDLARIMDTSDEWIATRTGVRERRFAEEGLGASDLAAEAARRALDSAGRGAVDAVITATMTPDTFAPGIAGLVQQKLGLDNVPAYDIRQQCSGFLYGLDLADALIESGKAASVLVVGAEAHNGFLPFGATWAQLYGATDEPVPPEDYERNTEARSWAVLFGDGAGAAVFERNHDTATGLLASSLHTDGSQFDLIHVPGVGFTRRPYVDHAQIEANLHLPTMRGRELFREAVTRMPESVSKVVGDVGLSPGDIDYVVAHQANARIVEGVRKSLGLDPERVPINIDRYGNTTAATLPILFHELRETGKITSGTLVCFTAFGAGAHWGAALYREP